MKKFFQKLRMDAKFARAGEGHKLTDDTRTYSPSTSSMQGQPYVRSRPMTASQAQAGAAALARQEERSKQTKTIVPKVMKTKSGSLAAEEKPTRELYTNEETQKKTVTSLVDNQVMFHSPFNEEIIPKTSLKNHMRENLLLRLAESPVEASSLMIHTLTSNTEKKQAAMNTLNKYLDNILNNPDEEKYMKIRKNNRIFSEKVAHVEGCEEFLEAVGFKRTVGDNDEIYFVMQTVDIEKLKEAKEVLASAEAMEFRLYRDAKILIPTGNKPLDFDLPNDFFRLTSSEIKREQNMKAEDVELNKQLRTRAMREAGKVTYKSNYTVIRIKFPDERLLQGTFRAHETVGDLKVFISDNINVEWAVFYLKTPLGELIDDDKATLLSYKLVPCAVLNLIWNEEIRKELLKEQGIDLALKQPQSY